MKNTYPVQRSIDNISFSWRVKGFRDKKVFSSFLLLLVFLSSFLLKIEEFVNFIYFCFSDNCLHLFILFANFGSGHFTPPLSKFWFRDINNNRIACSSMPVDWCLFIVHYGCQKDVLCTLCIVQHWMIDKFFSHDLLFIFASQKNHFIRINL